METRLGSRSPVLSFPACVRLFRFWVCWRSSPLQALRWTTCKQISRLIIHRADILCPLVAATLPEPATAKSSGRVGYTLTFWRIAAASSKGGDPCIPGIAAPCPCWHERPRFLTLRLLRVLGLKVSMWPDTHVVKTHVIGADPTKPEVYTLTHMLCKPVFRLLRRRRPFDHHRRPMGHCRIGEASVASFSDYTGSIVILSLDIGVTRVHENAVLLPSVIGEDPEDHDAAHNNRPAAAAASPMYAPVESPPWEASTTVDESTGRPVEGSTVPVSEGPEGIGPP